MRAASELRPPPKTFLVYTAVALAVILFWAVLTIWLPDHWSFGLAEVAVLALGCGMGTVRGQALCGREQLNTPASGWNRGDRAGATDDRAHGKSVGNLECGAAMVGIFDDVLFSVADRRLAGNFAAVPACVALFWLRPQRRCSAAVLHFTGQGVLVVSV